MIHGGDGRLVTKQGMCTLISQISGNPSLCSLLSRLLVLSHVLLFLQTGIHALERSGAKGAREGKVPAEGLEWPDPVGSSFWGSGFCSDFRVQGFRVLDVSLFFELRA